MEGDNIPLRDEIAEDQVAELSELEEHGSYQGKSEYTSLLGRWCNTSVHLIHDTLLPYLRLSMSEVLKHVWTCPSIKLITLHSDVCEVFRAYMPSLFPYIQN